MLITPSLITWNEHKPLVEPYILKHAAHPAYNRYVKKHLDQIYFEVDEENKRYQLYLFLHDLEQKLNFGELPF